MKEKYGKSGNVAIPKLEDLPEEIYREDDPLAIIITYFDGIGGQEMRYIPSISFPKKYIRY